MSEPAPAPMSVVLNRYAPGARLPRHVHAGATVSIVVRGWQVERIGGREYRRDPLSVVFKADGLEHDNAIGAEPTVAAFVEVPHEIVEGIEPRAGRGVERADAVSVRLLAAQLVAAANPKEADELVLAMLAELHADDRGDAAPPWLRRCRDALLDQFRVPPALAELARVAGVHRVHVAHGFRRHLRTTTRALVRRARVAEAARLALASRRSLAEIAVEVGFTDQSHMSRAFRATIGVAPGALRQTASRA